MGPETTTDCPGEDQQQIIWPKVQLVSSYTVRSSYIATTSEQTEDSMCAVGVVIYSVCRSVRLL
jgi:hypothetical protein